MDKDLPVKIYDLYFDQKVPVIEKHWHNSLEIIVPFSGNLQVWLNGEDLILTDQDILIVNSKEVHQFTWLKDNGVFKGYCLQKIMGFLKDTVCRYVMIMFKNISWKVISVLNNRLTGK